MSTKQIMAPHHKSPSNHFSPIPPHHENAMQLGERKKKEWNYFSPKEAPEKSYAFQKATF